MLYGNAGPTTEQILAGSAPWTHTLRATEALMPSVSHLWVHLDTDEVSAWDGVVWNHLSCIRISRAPDLMKF